MTSDFLKDPNLLDNIVKAVQQTGIIGEAIPIKTITLVCTGKLTLNKKQTSCNLHPEDTSGIGKDYLVEHISSVVFYRDWHKYDSPTPTAITYGQRVTRLGKDKSGMAQMGTVEKELTHGSIIHIKDASDTFLNGDDFKILLEGDVDTLKTIDKKAVHISFPKPIVIVTTADTITGYQIIRRVPSLPFDGTGIQTENIIKSQWDDKCNLIDKPTRKFDEIRNCFYSLKKVMVDLRNVKEYAEDKVPKSTKVIMRTLNSRLLDYICFSATLYQYQRIHESDNVILATEQDVDNGIEIFNYMYRSDLIDVNLLNPRQRRIHSRLRDNPDKTYTASDMLTWEESEGIGHTTIYEDIRAIMRIDSDIHSTDVHPKRYGCTIIHKGIQDIYDVLEEAEGIGKSQ